MKLFSLLLLACALAGGAAQTISLSHNATLISNAPPKQLKISMLTDSSNRQPAKRAHASREAAISLLRREGILYGRTRVLQAEWGKDTQAWLIILKHPKGIISHWFVDAAAKDYSGGTCKH